MKKLPSVFLLSLLLLFSFNQNTYAASLGERLTSPEAGWKRFDDKDPNIIYKGAWRDGNGDIYYNLSRKVTNRAGDTATLSFFGDKLRIITDSATGHSNKLNIEIDDVLESFPLNKGAGSQYLTYEKINLDNTWHKVVITTTDSLFSTIDAIDISENGFLGNPTLIEKIKVTSGEASADLNWGQVELATSYKIKRSTTSKGPYTTISNNSTGLEFHDSNLANDTTYYYIVEAYDKLGKLIHTTKECSVTPPYSSMEGMEGISPPVGTTATASSDDKNAIKALDRDFDSRWNAVTPIASLELKFPKPLHLNFVQLAAQVTPQTQVDYTIFGLKDGEWTQISPITTRAIDVSTQMRVLDRINVTEGVYSSIKITANARSSWASIHEITLGIVSAIPATPGSPGSETPTPEQTPNPEPSQPTGDRAILIVTMDNGLEKEFDLSMKEVNSFIAWYEGKQSGTGSASYAIDKHNNNKGPFSNRKDYVIFNKILTFDVSEYSTK